MNIHNIINEEIQLLLEKDTKIIRLERIITDAFNGLLNPNAVVSSPGFYVNNNPNTTWLQYLVFNFRHTFNLMSNQDMKYLCDFAHIVYSDSVGFDMRDDNTTEVNNVKRVIDLIKTRPALFNLVHGKNLSYEQLMDTFSQHLAEETKNMNNQLDNETFSDTTDYNIIEDADFETAKKYGNLSYSRQPLCYTQSKNTWDNYTGNGVNKCYIFYKTGFENIPEEHTDGNSAYDEYGLSLIFVFVNPENEITACNTRWNHQADYGSKTVDMAFDMYTLSKVLGIDARRILKGYSKEELKAKGVNYVRLDEVHGLLDSGVDPEEIFNFIGEEFEGFRQVMFNKKCNYITEDNKLLSQKWFKEVDDFNEGFACVQLESGRWSYINTDGELINDNGFEYAYDFKDGFGEVKLDNSRYSYINTDGELINDNGFEEADDFNDGFARVKLDNSRYSFINTEGKVVFPNGFKVARHFYNGFSRVQLDNGRYSFINTECEVINNDGFNVAYEFYNGLARVQLESGRWSYINTEGKVINTNGFKGAYDFYDGFAIVQLDNGRWVYINTEGQLCNKNGKPIKKYGIANESLKPILDKILLFEQRLENIL